MKYRRRADHDHKGAAVTGASGTAPHLVLLVRHALYLRNYESVIRRLADEGWTITLATLEGSRSVDETLAQTLADAYPGIARVRLPRAHGVLQEGRDAAYAALDWMRFIDARYHHSPALRERAERRVSRPLHAGLRMYGVERNTRRRMRMTVRLERWGASGGSDRSARRSLAALAPDVVAVSPLIDIAGGQHAFVTASRALGIPSALLVASWDNLTNKGLIHEAPDRVMVWNRYQAEEAFRLHDVPRERITVTGAQLFDWLREPMPLPSREEFLTGLGLDPGKATVVYVGSSSAVGAKEGGILGEIVLPALRKHSDRRLATANIIVRPHPTNPFIVGKTEASLAKHGAVADPLAGDPVVDEATRRHYRALLTHADAVIGVNTSAFLEAAVVGTPSVPLTARRLSSAQQTAPHFRLLISAGLFEAPRSVHGTLNRLSATLDDPEARALGLQEFVRDFIDAPDGFATATDAVAAALANTSAQAAATAPARRGSLLALSLLFVLGITARLDRWARRARHRIRAAFAARGARRAARAEARARAAVVPAAVPAAAPPGLAPAAAQPEPAPVDKVRLTDADKIRIHQQRRREKTRIAFKVDAYRMLHGPHRYGAFRRALRRVRKLGYGWLKGRPGFARVSPESGWAARTFYTRISGPVISARARRAATSRVATLRESLTQAARSGQPVVFGPWTSEIGFELLYWAPFITRLLQTSGVDPANVTIVSRGGTSGWYSLPQARYRDVFDVVGPREFHDLIGNATPGKKQVDWTDAERRIIERFAPEGALIVHPAEMYLALMPFFAGRVPQEWLADFLAPTPVSSGRADAQWRAIQSRLPERYVALALYRRPSFGISPEDPGLNGLLRSAREAGLPLVSLDTGLVLDDHRALDLSRVWMSRPLIGVDPAVNLDLQTRIIAGASGLIATYGGTSYLGGLLGVPTVALYDDPSRILWHHLDVARERFEGGMYQVTDLDTCDVPGVIEAFERTVQSTVRSEEVA
jgi:ADP-heptose:LPS heptosyltransferase